jgi:hypothetical protein
MILEPSTLDGYPARTWYTSSWGCTFLHGRRQSFRNWVDSLVQKVQAHAQKQRVKRPCRRRAGAGRVDKNSGGTDWSVGNERALHQAGAREFVALFGNAPGAFCFVGVLDPVHQAEIGGQFTRIGEVPDVTDDAQQHRAALTGPMALDAHLVPVSGQTLRSFQKHLGIFHEVLGGRHLGKIETEY